MKDPRRNFKEKVNGYRLFVDTQRELDTCYFSHFTELKEPRFKSTMPKKNKEPFYPRD